MAKKKQTSRGERPRRPKRIISGITEFIDDDWWEDSRHSGRDKRRESSDRSDTKKSDTKKTAQVKEKDTVEDAASSKAPPKRKKAHRQTEKREIAATEPKAKPEPAGEEPSLKKSKRRRRKPAKKEMVEATVLETPPREKIVLEEQDATPKKKRRRRKSTREKVERIEQAEKPEKIKAEEPPREERAARPKRRKKKVETKPEIQAEKPSREERPTRSQPKPQPSSQPKQRQEVKSEVEEEFRERRNKTTKKKKVKDRVEEKLPVDTDRKSATTQKVPVTQKVQRKERSTTRQAVGFGAMDLSEEMFEALELAGYSEPTPIQAGLIPEALKGNDLMGQAQTGTGKTAAFAIPLLERVDFDTEHRGPQALVLVPTRELAVQVRDECAKLAETGEIQVVAIYGGKPIRRQVEKLRRSPEIVVGTPGRVIDLNARGALFFGDVRHVVLDEADRMLDIGFRPDIEKILRKCPESRQTLLLSATLPDPVLRLAKRYMRDPAVLDFSPMNIAVETIDQYYFTIDPERKFDLLVKLLERENPKQAIIFCRTRRGTEKIYRRLSRQNLESVACIHGDLTQSTRDSTMRMFRSGKLQLLVATDVVGRGIDVSGVSHIINYDIPEFCDDYVHRVGRTGRMGREGVAYSFISPEEGPQLTRIEMRINILLKRAEMPGFDMGIKAVSDDSAPAPESKPVYGKTKRRFRRAL